MSLFAYYPLDRDVKDYSGNGNHATNSTAAAFTTSAVTGIIQYALDLEQADSDYITLPVLQSLSAFTIAVRLKVESDPGADMYLLDLKNGNSRIAIYYDTTSNTVKAIVSNSAGTSVTIEGSDINDGNTTLIELKYDGSTVTLYEDTVSQNSDNLTGTVDLSALADYGYIGATGSTPSNFFDGLVDELRLYNTSISSDSSDELNSLNSGVKCIVNGRPGLVHTGEFSDYDNSYRTDYAKFTTTENPAEDLSVALRAEIKRNIMLLIDGRLRFNGTVTNFNPAEDDDIFIYADDYSIVLNGKRIYEYDMNGMTASQAIEDLIDTYGQGIFTKNITATTRTYDDDVLHFMTPVQIMQELTLRENYSLRLSPDLEWTFQSRSSNDLGLTYSEGTGFYEPSFPQENNRITNSLYAIDDSGQLYYKPNLSSISKNYERPGVVDAPDATNETHIRNTLNSRLARGKERLIPAQITIDQDFSVVSTGLIRMNYAKLGWSNKLVYVSGLVHYLDSPEASLEMVNYSADQDEALSNLFFDRRQLQKRNIDFTKPQITLADMELRISVAPKVTVEKQTNLNYTWNDSGQDDGVVWNTQPTAWQEVVAEVDMTPMQDMLNRLRDLLQGEAVDALDAANTTIKIGTGSTAVTINDTDLDTAIAGADNGMDAGYPEDPADTIMRHQISLSDTDIDEFSGAQEIGLFVSGSLMARVVLGATFSKAVNEIFRINIETTFADADPIKLMTAMLNRIRDIAVGLPVTALDNSNAFVKLGTGTTAVTAADTDLDTEIAATNVGMDAGFPQDGLIEASAEHRGSITNTEIVSFSAREAGLFANSNLMARLVFPSSLDKATGETVRPQFITEFVEAES